MRYQVDFFSGEEGLSTAFKVAGMRTLTAQSMCLSF
jgi:hypothetical protein